MFSQEELAILHKMSLMYEKILERMKLYFDMGYPYENDQELKLCKDELDKINKAGEISKKLSQHIFPTVKTRNELIANAMNNMIESAIIADIDSEMEEDYLDYNNEASFIEKEDSIRILKTALNSKIKIIIDFIVEEEDEEESLLDIKSTEAVAVKLIGEQKLVIYDLLEDRYITLNINNILKLAFTDEVIDINNKSNNQTDKKHNEKKANIIKFTKQK